MSRSCTRPVAGPRSARDPGRDAACAVFPSAVADRDPGLPRVHTRGAGDTRAWRSRNLRIAWVGCEHRRERIAPPPLAGRCPPLVARIDRRTSTCAEPDRDTCRLHGRERDFVGAVGQRAATRPVTRAPPGALLLLMASLQEHLDRH